MLTEDAKLQEFLTWVKQKAHSVGKNYKPAAIRAFYFALVLNLDFAFALTRDLDCEVEVDLDLDLDFVLDLDLARASDLAPDFTLDFALECTFARALERTFAPDPDPDPDHDFYFYFAPDLARAFAFALALAPDLELKQSLHGLKAQLPNPNLDWDQVKEWWEVNSTTWTEQLRAVMLEHRDIGHDWQFTDAQTQLLQQYYDANKLLVNCLKSGYISREVRQEIEDSLLLPLSEIEQRFPNQLRPH